MTRNLCGISSVHSFIGHTGFCTNTEGKKIQHCYIQAACQLSRKGYGSKTRCHKVSFLAPSLFDDKMNAIGDITGGKFEFDNKTRNLFWKKEGVKYSPVNVASGIKAFGVMQILMETQAINENKILIWDEPENHLHPEWQIKIAQLFVEIAKAGVPILISSHSPYFIQGVRYFTEKHELNKFIELLFSKRNGRWIKGIRGCNERLEPDICQTGTAYERNYKHRNVMEKTELTPEL